MDKELRDDMDCLFDPWSILSEMNDREVGNLFEKVQTEFLGRPRPVLLLSYRFPLRSGRFADVRLADDFSQADYDRLVAILNTLITPTRPPA